MYIHILFLNQNCNKKKVANVVPLLSACILFVGVFLFASLKGRKVGQRPLRTRVQTHIVRYAASSEQIMALDTVRATLKMAVYGAV